MTDSLHNQDIDVLFKYKGGTQEIQGISFTKGKYSFKGSAIDHSFSYAKIDRQIKEHVALKQGGTSKQTLQKSDSPGTVNQNSIASNIANYLNSIGVAAASSHHKLLSWDKNKDEEDEEIEELLKRSQRRIKM